MLKTHTLLNYILKFISIIVSYITIPILLKMLDKSQYGVWLTILSITSWVSICDFGFGYGLRNKLIESFALNDKKKALEYITNSYVNVFSIAVILIITSYLLLHFINLSNVLNSTINKTILERTLFITAVFVILNLSLSLIKQIFFAINLSFVVSIIDTSSQIIFLSFIPILLLFNNKLIGMSFMYGLSLIIPLIISSLFYFNRNKTLIPKLKSYSKIINKDIGSLSSLFFISQIAAIIVFTTGNIIIAHYTNTSEVTIYNVVYKLFSGFIIIHQILLLPVWTAYSESHIKNDYLRIKNIFRKTIYAFIFLSLGTIVLVIFAKYILHLWLRKDLFFSNILIISMAMYTIVYMWNASFNQILCGISKIRLSTFISIISAVINIPISIFLVKYFNGATGVVLSITICLLLSAITAPIQVWYFIYNKNKTRVGNKLLS